MVRKRTRAGRIPALVVCSIILASPRLRRVPRFLSDETLEVLVELGQHFEVEQAFFFVVQRDN